MTVGHIEFRKKMSNKINSSSKKKKKNQKTAIIILDAHYITVTKMRVHRERGENKSRENYRF